MSKFRSAMMFFALSGWASSHWRVPLISWTHWKFTVRLGRGSFPSLISLMYARPTSSVRRSRSCRRWRPASIALEQVSADRDFLRRAAVAGNLGVDDLLLVRHLLALVDRSDGDLLSAREERFQGAAFFGDSAQAAVFGCAFTVVETI